MRFILGENTYMTLEEANEIMTDEFASDSAELAIWNQLDLLGKQRLILNGTRIINTLVWIGRQYPGYQELAWPRIIQYRYVDCPYDVKVAILKQALLDSINDEKQEVSLQELGVKSYKIKDASIEFIDGHNRSKLANGIYEKVYKIYLEKWVA